MKKGDNRCGQDYFEDRIVTAENCQCPEKKCIRHGKCVECTQYHAEKNRDPTAKDQRPHYLGF